MRFEVKWGNQVMGHSDLEAGDAPMGVAGGRFWPAPAYSSIQPHCIRHRDCWLPMAELTIGIAGGQTMECSGGVCIQDFSRELGEREIEVSIEGVPYPLYEQLFPHHVQAYRDQFKGKSLREKQRTTES